MRITIKLFATLRERAGVGEMSLDLPEGATVESAAAALVDRVPGIRDHARHVAYAVNCDYVDSSARLKDGDELAVIPPVSGG